MIGAEYTQEAEGLLGRPALEETSFSSIATGRDGMVFFVTEGTGVCDYDQKRDG